METLNVLSWILTLLIKKGLKWFLYICCENTKVQLHFHDFIRNNELNDIRNNKCTIEPNEKEFVFVEYKPSKYYYYDAKS